MKIEAIEELIKAGREIEFRYKGKRFSITYYNDDREKNISVCAFYEKPTDVRNANEVFELKIGPNKLRDIFECLPDDAFDVY